MTAETTPTERGDGPCQDCGGLNIIWFTDNVVWNRVMEESKHVYASDRPETGILCPFCFVKRAEAAGLRPDGWRLLPDWPWVTALADANKGAPSHRDAPWMHDNPDGPCKCGAWHYADKGG